MKRWWMSPRWVIALTVPLAFIGLIVGKSVTPEAVLDATIAGGLVAILGSVVAGVFNNNNDKEDQ